MNIVKIILATIGIIIVAVLVLAAFIKKDYRIEREITINKPIAVVFDYVRLVKNQSCYNKWWMMDPNAKKDYHGTDGTVGFIAYWDSENKKVGKGEQEIKKITEGERIDYELRFIKPFVSTADTYVTTELLSANQTRVKWVFTGKNKYPMTVMNLFMDKMLGGDLETSLQNLKDILEK